MANRIVLNETSYHGAGAIKEIANEVKVRGFAKAFVCSDPDLIKFGVTKKVTDVLDEAGLAYEIYSNIKPNPTIENVQTGVAAFKASGADYLIAIGGGSSMDTAKAIGIIINNPEFEDVRSLEGVAPTKKPCVPIIAVPTTAGTAAEVTINYVITDVEKKRKFVCVDTHDIPVVAVIDPDMMSSMPKGLTASTPELLPPGAKEVTPELLFPGVEDVDPEDLFPDTPGPAVTTPDEPEELLPDELPPDELLPDAKPPVFTFPSMNVPFSMDCKPSLVCREAL